MEPLQRISPYLKEDWIFLVLIGILIALAVLRYSYPKILLRMSQALVRHRILLQLMREDKLMSHRVAVTLFLIFALSSGLLLYLAARAYNLPVTAVFNGYFYPLLAAAILVLYLFKVVMIRLVQLVFSGDGGLSAYLNYTFLVNSFLGLVFLPLILLVAVSLIDHAGVVLMIAFTIFGLAWLARIFQGILFALRQGVRLVYIILYLCALEILPLAVLAKGIAEVKF